ncbi:MAG: hypothetical protein FJ279_28120, partial [Planctomycetes bacterium]|nr:hypothetical protein [Planctomycetota bacterium]
MKRLATLLCVAMLLSQPLEAVAVNLIRNPGFEAGLASWHSRANEPSCASVDVSAHSGKSCVRLKAIASNCGIQTSPLYPGLDIQLDRTYALSAFVKNNGVRQGQFGIRLYCNDAEERCIVMKSFGEITAQTPAGGWQKHTFRFGPGADFQVPRETDHVFVRASFYRKDGDCEGEVMLDDFELVRENAKAARPVQDGEKGAVAVWRLEKATSGPLAEVVAGRLRERGYAATVLSTNDLTDDEKLSADLFDLLLVLDGSAYPVPGKMPLLRFLRGGGSLLVLGRPGAQAELYPTAGGWATEAELAVTPHADVPVNIAAGRDADVWKLNMDAKESKPSLELIADGDTRSLQMRSQLTAFQYATLDATPPPDTSFCILRFFAKGDARTPYLAVELNEKDKSRWKAVVPLSTSWQEYSLHTARFISYATEGRGGDGDHFHVERAAQVSFGYPSSLVGKGERSFSIRDVCWRKSRVAQDAPIRDGFV